MPTSVFCLRATPKFEDFCHSSSEVPGMSASGWRNESGGNLAQGASLVAWPDVTIDSAALLRLCGVSVMHVNSVDVWPGAVRT